MNEEERRILCQLLMITYQQGQVLIKKFFIIHKASNINGKRGAEKQILQLKFIYMHKCMHIYESIRGRSVVVEKSWK